MLLPCVVPCVLAFLHFTTEDQAVCGEDLWPPRQEDYFSLWTFWRTQNIHWQAQIKAHRQIFDKLSNNLPSTLRFKVGLRSDKKMRLVPLLVWHSYDPAFFIHTELMVRLFPCTVSRLPSLYHTNSHPIEMFMWQSNETESSVYIRLCSGDWISWTLGFVSEGSC